jgi:hypothetical protein
MAARFWVGGGSSANWNATVPTNWSATSGGVGNASVPVSTDDVTFDGGGVLGNSNATVNAISDVLSLNITAGYTQTITHNAELRIGGNWTMHTGFTIAGSSRIVLTATGTVTSGGKTWPNNINLLGNVNKTITLVGDFTVSGTFSTSAGTGTNAVNKTTAEKLNVSGLPLIEGLSGSALVYLKGGTWTGSLTTTLYLDGNSSIGDTVYGGALMEYVSGTVTVTGKMTINGSVTIKANAVTFNNIEGGQNLSASITLTEDLHVGATLSSFVVGTTGLVINKTASEKVFCNGITCGVNMTGTADIELDSGTWSDTGGGGGVSNNLTLVGGAITISGTVLYNTGTLTYTSGTITTTSSTLSLLGTCTLNTNGITWNNVTLTNTTGKTYTINSLLSISATLTIGNGATTTFAGSSGFTAATVTCVVTTAITVNFKESVTYTITASFSCFKSRTGSIVLFTSSHASTKANILMPNNGNNNCNLLASFTRIDASGGRTINTFNGTITDCTNIQSYTDRKPVGV